MTSDKIFRKARTDLSLGLLSIFTGISSHFKSLKSTLDHKRSDVLPLKFDGLLCGYHWKQVKSGILILKGSVERFGLLSIDQSALRWNWVNTRMGRWFTSCKSRLSLLASCSSRLVRCRSFSRSCV